MVNSINNTDTVLTQYILREAFKRNACALVYWPAKLRIGQGILLEVNLKHVITSKPLISLINKTRNKILDFHRTQIIRRLLNLISKTSVLTPSQLYQNYLRLLQISPILLALRANLAGEFSLWLLLLDLLAIL